MASGNTHMRIFKETLENEAVLILSKPCDPLDICNIWRHVCRKNILVEGCEYSNRESPEENQECKKRKHIKTRIKWTDDLHKKFVDAINSLGEQKAYPTAILELMKVPGLTRSQVASHLQKYHEHQKTIKNPKLMPQMQGGISLQVESHGHKICGQSTPSSNYSSIPPSSITQPPLKLNSVGVSYMTINNIKARLQEAPTLPIPQPTTTVNNSDSDQSTDRSFCHQFQSSMGDTGMINTFGLGESSNNTFRQTNEDQMMSNVFGSATGPLENGNTLSMAPVDGGELVTPVDSASFSNGFVSKSYEGLGGYPGGGGNYNYEMCESSSLFGKTNYGSGGNSASSNHNNPEHLTLPKFFCRNLGLLHSRGFRGNGENLFPTFPHTTNAVDIEHSINLNISSSDSVSFRVGSVGYSHPRFSGEETNMQEQTLPPFNSIVSVDIGFERTVRGSGFPPNVNQGPLDMTVNILDELDVDLINGPW